MPEGLRLAADAVGATARNVRLSGRWVWHIRCSKRRRVQTTIGTARAPGAGASGEPAFVNAGDFSLVLGGPLYQIWRRARLTGDALQLIRRRVVVMTCLTWVPLLLLSIASGRAWGTSVGLPFLYDLDVHLRFLLALPLLVVAELIVHMRMRPVVAQFLNRGLIPTGNRAQFDAAIADALRLRNSVTAEVLLLVLVYVVGIGFVWRTQGALDVASWYGASSNGRWYPSPAGWWMALISLPVFQFLLVRWYFRLFIWARFLWHVSRIPLSLEPAHPDRCGGLGFLANVSHALVPFLLAQGVILCGTLANRIFFAGAELVQFKVELIGMAALMLFAVLGPMLVFAQQLAAAKRVGMREFGTLAQTYVREFGNKWLRGGADAGEPLIGTADIQSLADLGNSFEIVKGMRWVPFTLQTVFQLAVITLLPVLPLMLTMISLEQLLERLLTLIF